MKAASFLRGLIAISGIAMLLSGAAMAQTTTQGPGTKSPPASDTTSATPPSVAAPRPVASPLAREDVSKVIGSSVYGPDDRRIGSVSTVLMQPKQLKIDRLVVAEGGLLGIGSRLVAIPVDEFLWDSAKGVFKVTMTGEEMKFLPAWKEQLTALPQ